MAAGDRSLVLRFAEADRSELTVLDFLGIYFRGAHAPRTAIWIPPFPRKEVELAESTGEEQMGVRVGWPSGSIGQGAR